MEQLIKLKVTFPDLLYNIIILYVCLSKPCLSLFTEQIIN